MRILTGLLLLLPIAAHAAVPLPIGGTPPGLLCRAAIASAEQTHAIPPHLMAAIGRVESGRKDPTTGTIHPWPWTINAEGQGALFDTKAQAIEAVRALQARGVKSIDVGCMQINLMYHPEAFASLEQAFDPVANTAYAAQFLRTLYAQTNDWTKATGLYHSATPELAEPYARSVMAALADESKMPAGPSALASAWAATMAHPVMAPPARTVGALTPAPIGAPPIGAGRGLDAYRAQPVGIAARPLHTVSRF
jgi:Transglycosylase SLT domain